VPTVSHEGIIKDPNSEIGSIDPGSDHHIEEPNTTFVESVTSYTNPLFTNPLGPPLIDPLSTIYVDDFSSYRLPPGSTTTPYFCVNPSSFGFPEGLGNLSFLQLL
jgi:hypothetical protein